MFLLPLADEVVVFPVAVGGGYNNVFITVGQADYCFSVRTFVYGDDMSFVDQECFLVLQYYRKEWLPHELIIHR